MKFLAVFIGGGLGSLARYGISLLVLKTKVEHFPLATMLSNFFACLILALCVYSFKDKMDATTWFTTFVITGFCGGFSTFSTFSFETFNLIQHGNYLWAGGNIVISLAFGLGIFWILK